MDIFHTPSLRRQQGSAIIFAMGISLLVVALSVALLLWLTLDMRRVTYLQEVSQRMASLQISEAMAAQKISELQEGWEQPWEVEANDISLSAKLEDLTARLNINVLLSHESQSSVSAHFSPSQVFKRFFKQHQIKEGNEILENLIEENQVLLGIGAIPALEPVKDYFYGAEPDQQKVNINTVSPAVFSSIFDIPESSAEALLMNKPFSSSQDIHRVFDENQMTYEEPSPIDTWLTTEGEFYLLETTIQQNKTMKIYTVFQRQDERVTLKWRSWGTLP